jgi:nucleotide-binding universal stress UspA family protein
MHEPSKTQASTMVETILVGLDGSASGTRALEWATQFAAAVGATVVGVHVLTFDEEFVRDGITVDTMRTWRRDLERDMKGSWMEPVARSGVAHRHHVVEADSIDEGLLACAARENADLIVIGERGSSGLLARILDGSTYRVMHRASQPLVVVPHGWCPEPSAERHT